MFARALICRYIDLHVHISPSIYRRRVPCCPPQLGLYTILPLPILYGMCGNKGSSGGNTVLCDSVGDEGRKWGAQTKGVFAKNSIDSCTKASS